MLVARSDLSLRRCHLPAAGNVAGQAFDHAARELDFAARDCAQAGPSARWRKSRPSDGGQGMKLTLIKPTIGRMAHSLYVDEARMEPLNLGVLAALTPADVDVVMYDDLMEPIPYHDPTDLD